MFDTIIVGYGPAGISAAIYLLRAGKKVALIGKDIGSLEKAEKIDNYYGVLGSVSGKELAKQGMEQAKNLGAEIFTQEVLNITFEDGYVVETNTETHTAKSVLLATGAQRKTVAIKGVSEFEGKGVSYCAVCDAFFYRGKTVGVLGSGDYALHEISALLAVVGKAYLLTNGQQPPENLPENVQVITEKINEIKGEEAVAAVVLANGEEIALDGVFIALGSAGAGDFARKIGAAIDPKGSIVVDKEMKTAVPGLFAAGDCTGGFMQVATAVSEGATASMSILKFLKG